MPQRHLLPVPAAPRSLVAILAIATASGCAPQAPRLRTGLPTDPPPPAIAAESPAAPPADPISLEAWPAETFALPPAFAPELPTGSETLRFAPGWRDPASDDFWSYAFIMWIDEPTPDALRLAQLLETYYRGLMSAFAVGTDHDVSSTPPQVDLILTSPGTYEARMHLIDAFATFKPIDLRLVIEVAPETAARSMLSIQVSPQPPHHPIWRSLRAAILDILTQHEAPHG